MSPNHIVARSNVWDTALLRVVAVLCATTLAVTISITNADAYAIWHKTWSSTASTKTPVFLRNNVPTSWDSVISLANKKWNLLSGSSLKTGNAVSTIYSSTYSAAPFRLGTTSFYGKNYPNAPGITFSIAGNLDNVLVLFNTDWTFSGYFNQASQIADLPTVATHEFGHAYALDHPCDPLCTTAEKVSLMNVTFTIKTNPTSDDVAGIASIY